MNDLAALKKLRAIQKEERTVARQIAGQALAQAIELAGGQADLARALGVKRQAVFQWVKEAQVPALKVLEVERLTGISRHSLRPDVYPVQLPSEEARRA